MAKKRSASRFSENSKYAAYNDPRLTDDEVIRLIASVISAHIQLGNQLGHWQDHFPEFIPFLKKTGITEEEALRRLEMWRTGVHQATAKARGPRPPFPSYGSVGDTWLVWDGGSVTTAIVETAAIGQGEKSKPDRIKNTDYLIVPGKFPELCPQASTRPAIEQLLIIEAHLRQERVLRADETIHWRGPGREIHFVCHCFSSSKLRAKATSPDALGDMKEYRRKLARRVIGVLAKESPLKCREIGERLQNCIAEKDRELMNIPRDEELGGKVSRRLGNLLRDLGEFGLVVTPETRRTSLGYRLSPRGQEYAGQHGLIPD